MTSTVAERPDEPILHADLDAFYASVEVRKNPALKGKPVIVSGLGNRGVVMAASYEARRYGVHSAMPVVRARRLCPKGEFVAPDFEAYRADSESFREVCQSFTPLVETIALDEAFLDVGGATRLFGEPPEIAGQIRARVKDAIGVSCSVGIAPNKFLAKLGSAQAKPDGVCYVRAGEVQAFLQPLPVGALWGAGAKTVEALRRLGVKTVGDLGATPRAILARLLGENHADTLLALARGEDDRAVIPWEAPKSISHEETFSRDLDDEEELLREVLALAHKVAARLRKGELRARTVTLKVRLANFTTLTRSRTMPEATDLASDLYAAAAEMFRKLPGERRRVRLIGVAASGLESSELEQLALLGHARWGDLERTLDRIDRRFGHDSAMPATLLERDPSKVRQAPLQRTKQPPYNRDEPPRR